MSWSTLRQATEEDYRILDQKAREFAKRHGIQLDPPEVTGMNDYYTLELELLLRAEQDSPLEGPDWRYRRQLWKRILRRALKEPRAEGIAWDYVGFHVD